MTTPGSTLTDSARTAGGTTPADSYGTSGEGGYASTRSGAKGSTMDSTMDSPMGATADSPADLAGKTSGREPADGFASSSTSGARDPMAAVRGRAEAMKERAVSFTHDVEGRLADTLERGAERLRSRESAPDGRMHDVAGRIDGTAQWLREGDLAETLSAQAQRHPARTMAFALGAGFLIGRLLRR